MNDVAPPDLTVAGDRVRLLHDDLRAEYYALADLVTSFDQRLLTIKGWGVTLSLASLGAGFQQDRYGLFLVAAVSGLAFWMVEGTTKLHQMRHYPRMGDIEVAMFEMFGVESPAGRVSSPLLDWSWYTAQQRLHDGPFRGDPTVPEPWPSGNPPTESRRVGARSRALLFPHVALPHAIAVGVGGVLFVLGLLVHLGRSDPADLSAQTIGQSGPIPRAAIVRTRPGWGCASRPRELRV